MLWAVEAGGGGRGGGGRLPCLPSLQQRRAGSCPKDTVNSAQPAREEKLCHFYEFTSIFGDWPVGEGWRGTSRGCAPAGTGDSSGTTASAAGQALRGQGLAGPGWASPLRGAGLELARCRWLGHGRSLEGPARITLSQARRFGH